MKLSVDKSSRYAKMRAHTGVHLLYGALEKVTGRNNIKQAGSFVDEDYGRLDFNADKPLSNKQLKQIEDMVNKWIKKAIDVNIFESSIEEAIRKGAKAFFDEKYGKRVRVVDIPGVDIQLCGGTHVSNTSYVGAFKIETQEAVASGIKRLSILTGPKVALKAIEQENYIHNIAESIDCAPAQILQKVKKIQKEASAYKSELENMKESIIVGNLKKLEKKEGQFNYNIALEDFDGIDFKTLLQKVRSNLNGNILIYSKQGNFAIITEDFSAKEFAQEKGLKGGGNDNMVQGKDPKILEILQS